MIGGDAITDPIVVTDSAVTIKISNAAAGHVYGYRKSVTLAGLATVSDAAGVNGRQQDPDHRHADAERSEG